MGAGKSKKISVEGVQDGSGNASNDENNELSKSTSSSYLDDDDFGDAPEFWFVQLHKKLWTIL